MLAADVPGTPAALIVFSPVMKEDSPETASALARELADPRVLFLWDPGRAVGRALLAPLGLPASTGFAWDTYCLYLPGAEWRGEPPAPDHWAHQLWGADPAHSRPGRVEEDLRAWLEEVRAR